MRQKWIKIIVNVCRVLFAATFLFSGFVKAVDPMGSAYKFIDYFRAFDLTFLNPFAVMLSMSLAATEFTIGSCILWGASRRLATSLGALFMAFFTPLTLYLAISNPVNDCGCFGDALVLTNWQTFWKNLILLPISILLFIRHKDIIPLFQSKNLRLSVVLFSILFSIGISKIALYNLPIIDFRPFKTGVNIKEAMQTSASAEPVYQLIYQKDGVEKTFTLDDYPANDSTWQFVETRTILPSDVKEASIKDFFLLDEEGNNITDQILNHPGFTFLVISPDLEQADDTYIDRINNLYDFAKENGYSFYGVTVQDREKQSEWIEGTGAEYPFISSDATVLETVVRANPGIVLLKEGTIVWKKNPAFLPEENEIIKSIESYEQGVKEKNNTSFIILCSIICFFGPILVLLLLEKTRNYIIRKRHKNPSSTDFC